MKKIINFVITCLHILTMDARATEDPCDQIGGLWVLTQMTPVHPENSNPRGMINIRRYIDLESKKIYSSLPDDKKVKSSESMLIQDYVCENGAITYPKDDSNKYSSYSTITIINSIDSERMELEIAFISQFETRSEVHLYTRNHFKSKGDRHEPVSIHVLQIKDSDLNVMDVVYDEFEYSSLPLNKRILGVWESVRFKNPPKSELPPYGLVNDIFTITEKSICWLKRYPPEQTDCYEYELNESTLTWLIDNKRFIDSVSFNEWGQLELKNGIVTHSLKLITKDISQKPDIPLKVVLLEWTK